MVRLCTTVPINEVISEIRRLWGIELTRWQVKSFKGKRKLRSGLNPGRFEPGNVPPNKGKTWDEFMSPESQERARAGCFKGGEMHGAAKARWVPIGTERTGPDGYVRVKVTEDYTNNLMERWRPRSHIVWERVHGPIPDGFVVMHVDGDRANDDPDNLALAPKSLVSTLNRFGPKWADRETFEVALLAAEVTQAAARASREGE